MLPPVAVLPAQISFELHYKGWWDNGKKRHSGAGRMAHMFRQLVGE